MQTSVYQENTKANSVGYWEGRAARVGGGPWDRCRPFGAYVADILNLEDSRNAPMICAYAVRSEGFRADPSDVETMVPDGVSYPWAHRLVARWRLGETLDSAQIAAVRDVLKLKLCRKTREVIQC